MQKLIDIGVCFIIVMEILYKNTFDKLCYVGWIEKVVCVIPLMINWLEF